MKLGSSSRSSWRWIFGDGKTGSVLVAFPCRSFLNLHKILDFFEVNLKKVFAHALATTLAIHANLSDDAESSGPLAYLDWDGIVHVVQD